MKPNEALMTKILAKTTILGLAMNVVAPVIYVVLAVYLTGEQVSSASNFDVPEQNNLQLLFYIFLLISILGLAVTWYLKLNIPPGMISAEGESVEKRFEKGSQKMAVIIFALNDAYALLGLVLMLLGAAIELMMIFVALSFIGYQLFRPRRAFLERIWERIESAEAGRMT